MMIDLKKILSRNLREKIMYTLSFLPDKLYLQFFYFATTGRLINFKNPKGFNEKLQWLKVNNKRPEFGPLVDKLAVREYISKILGEEYLFPLLGAWESFDDIDFNSLPEQFVLKCNHDSGSVKVIKSKSALTQADFDEMKVFYTKRLKRDFFYAGREYPYKGLKPYIMAEKFMFDENNPDVSLIDHKFFCFNGEPRLLLTISGREKKQEGGYREDFFDMDYNLLPVTNGFKISDSVPAKPQNFEKMKEIAKVLTKDMAQVRLDFYEINGKLYFGEFTFFSSGGFLLFEPEEWEQKLGSWIELN